MSGWESFMKSSARHQREQASKTRARGAERPKTWKAHLKPSERHRRDVAAHNTKLQNTYRKLRANAPSDACPLCYHTGAIVFAADTACSKDTNEGFAFYVQCYACLRRVHDPTWGPPSANHAYSHARETNETIGWGKEDFFDDQDDVVICKLLNAHGMPCTDTGAPSRLHFHRSLIHFHHRFGARKRWSALTTHLLANFTTTMSRPSAMLPPAYRGWYRIRR